VQSAHQGQKYFILYQVSQGTINTQDQVSFDSSYCLTIGAQGQQEEMIPTSNEVGTSESLQSAESCNDIPHYVHYMGYQDEQKKGNCLPGFAKHTSILSFEQGKNPNNCC